MSNDNTRDYVQPSSNGREDVKQDLPKNQEEKRDPQHNFMSTHRIMLTTQSAPTSRDPSSVSESEDEISKSVDHSYASANNKNKSTQCHRLPYEGSKSAAEPLSNSYTHNPK